MRICDKCGCEIGDIDWISFEWKEFFRTRYRRFELCYTCREELIKQVDSFIKNAP